MPAGLGQQLVHGRAFVGRLGEEAVDQGAQALVAHPAELGGGLDYVVHHRVLVAHPVAEGERAGRRVGQYATEREHIALRARALAAYLLRGHEAR